ncbi:MAG: AbiV [Mucilaginibacter sp.]|nr:AbiV [Mucilaginibacter sp.]
MPKLPTDPQALERTVLELAAASFVNARKLHQAAQAVLDQELWPGAFSWSALAAEEVGKAVLCISLLAMPPALREQARADFHKAFTDHQAKAGFAHFVLAVGAEEMPASMEQMLDDVVKAARQTNAMKFRGLYVDYTDTGALLQPEDVGEDAARFMVGTVARLLEESALAESSVTDDPDDYLDFLHQWQDSVDYEALGAFVDAEPLAFLAAVRAFIRDDAPPSALILGDRLAEQVAAAASPSEVPPGEEAQPSIG